MCYIVTKEGDPMNRIEEIIENLNNLGNNHILTTTNEGEELIENIRHDLTVLQTRLNTFMKALKG